MATYVLANKNTTELETTVFSSESGDTVAVFTDAKKASAYLEDAGWQDEMTVAQLNSVQFMEWLIMCHRNGVKLMATDPLRSEQEAGRKVNTLEIDAQLDQAGEFITQVANREF